MSKRKCPEEGVEMHKYKLIYFNCRGRAEICRMLFALAGVEYEDVRYELEAWKNGLKDKVETPFGQLPVLEIDDGKEVLSQSNSINRYLAEEFGYGGTTALEKAHADMVAHCFQDYAYSIWGAFMEEDKERKEKMMKKFKEEELPRYFKYFEAMLIKNNGGDGYFVGSELTYADLTFVHQLSYLKPLAEIDPEKFIADYPKLKALQDRVLQVPKLAEYIAKRPETLF